jgi:hypothetical protein
MENYNMETWSNISFFLSSNFNILFYGTVANVVR